MEKRVKRRSDALICQYLWDAITTIRNHKQLPSFDRIRRYMNRTHSMDSDKVEKHLEDCRLDNLITVSRKVGQKGSKVGVEQEGFRLPTPPDEPESHDWYCFECHQGGDVSCCSKCYRVFHQSCITPQDYPYPPDVFVCTICKKRLYQRTSGRCRIAREELNVLLGYSIARLKERLPVNLMERVITSSTSTSSSSSSQKPGFPNERGPGQPVVRSDQVTGGVVTAEPWRAQFLLHHQMDLLTMEQKAQDGRYKTPYDFEIDATTILHNAVIFHGVHSPVADMARLMLRDCQHDLAELEQCKDCYRHSHEKHDRLWFCKPCNPPHELVYAKQKGFPFWPAKVLKIESDMYEVRFFGNQHQRAVIEKNHVRPITVNIHSLQSKRTSAWNKACEELKKHQELLEVYSQHQHPTYPPPPPQHSYQQPPAAASQPPPQPPQPFFQPPFPHYQAHQQCLPHHQHLLHHHQSWEAIPPAASHQSGMLTPRPQAPPLHSPVAPLPPPAPPRAAPLAAPVKKETEEKNASVVVTAAAAAQDEAQPEKEASKEPEDVEAASRSDEAKKPRKETKIIEEPPIDQAPSISSSSKASCLKNEPPVPEDVVSSSCQELRTQSVSVQTSHRLLKSLLEELSDQSGKRGKESKEVALKELADKLRREHEVDKQKVAQVSSKQIEKQIEKSKDEFRSKIVELEEKHKTHVSDTKRKQWCWTCESEAIYHCCWNTAYCSIECQQIHWHKEHKKLCRRKR